MADNPQNDALIGTYNFADVKLVSSSNGVTWSAPVKANINALSNTDHFRADRKSATSAHGNSPIL